MSAGFSRSSTPPQRDWAPVREARAGRRDALAGPVQSGDQLKLHLRGQITRLEQELSVLRSRLQALDGVGGTSLDAPPQRRRSSTPRPALAPLLLSLLPPAGTLCSIDDIISGMLMAENLATDDRPARSKAYRRAHLCLHKLRAEGVVISHRIGSGRLDWGLNPDPAAGGDQAGA